MKTAIPINPRPKSRQRGAALLIAMLIVVLGLVTLLTFRSDRKGPEMEAQRKTALALAQAKEALLGRAASDNTPGSLSCPSVNGVMGQANTVTAGPAIKCGTSVATSSNLGWFAWKTLGLGELRDGRSALLWYMLSDAYIDSGDSPPPYAATLQVSIIEVDVNPTDLSEVVISNTAVPNVAAVILAPGSPLPGQNRSGVALTDSSNWAAYLEVAADSAANSITIKVERKHDGAPPVKYNDQYLFITAKEILERSTPRVARALADRITDYRNSTAAYPPTGWLPITADWTGSGLFAKWAIADPLTGVIPAQFQNFGLSGSAQFSGCAAIFNIQYQPSTGIDQVKRAGHC